MAEGFSQWAIVEVMGRQVYAGLVTEQTIGGCPFVRVDVPAVEGQAEFTKFLGSGAIFSITPVGEELARRAAENSCTRPVSIYGVDAQRQLAYEEE